MKPERHPLFRPLGFRETEPALSRRHFLQQTGLGLGTAALATLLGEQGFGQGNRTSGPHHAPKARSVIFLFMAGAPSQLDMFDYKPKLAELDGQPIPGELIQGERFAFIAGDPRLLGSPHPFAKRGKSGAWVSDLLPDTAGVVDELAIIRSMHTDQFNHAPAQIFMNCGHQLVGRPSMGSWAVYGLGSENADLPGFVVLLSGVGQPDGGKSCWSSGFLPTQYQGVEFRSQGDPVLAVSNPKGMDPALRRRSLDALRDLNEIQLGKLGDPEIATRIAAYELAFRMQTSVPELADLSKEPQSIRDMYGTEPGKASFANNCLLARRLVERGVRFVQLYHRGWDSHGTGTGDDIVHSLPLRCRETDRACAALIRDLKQRGLLESTLVVWGGEFGRTPMNERRNGSTFLGRDHHPRAFTMWAAGAGIKPGTVLGATDPFGYNITEDPVHVHDLHATILHLLGIEHTRLTYKFQGREFRLTDVAGKLVTKLLA